MEEAEIQARVDRAIELHHNKFNCAQSVACAFEDVTDVDENTLFKLAEGLGAGLGGMQGTCGALTGAALVLGYTTSDTIDNPTTKGETYKQVKPIVAAFDEKNGSTICHELKGIGTGEVLRSCDGCIEDACRLLGERL